MRVINHFFILTIFYAVLLSLLVGCANVVKPNGGPKDTEPPTLIESSPPNFCTQFQENKIILSFNEFVRIKNPSQILVSPPLKYKPTFKIKQKSIVVILKDTLKENTTYSINFGESIIDITEGNAKKNFQYVFSTGDYVDSFQVSGSLLLAKDLSKPEGIMVMLYPEGPDSLPYNELPYYFTKADKNGNWLIQYVKEGNYLLFALKDQNFTYKFDQPNELIGFSDTLITIDTIKRSYQLRMFQEEGIIKQALLDKTPLNFGSVQVVLKHGSANTGLKPLDIANTVVYGIERNKTLDTLVLWLKDTEIEKAKFVLSDADTIVDTISLKFKPQPLDTIRANIKLGIKHNMVAMFGLGQPISLKFAQPILTADLSKILMWEDTTRKLIQPKIYFKDSIKRNLVIEYQWNQQKLYEFLLTPDAFKDIYGLTHDTVFYKFTTKKEEDYGILLLQLDSMDVSSQYIIRLLDSKGNVSRETIISGKKNNLIKYSYLLPSKYNLSVIRDENKNGKWDPGNYLEKRQAEKVFNYKEELDLRPNWEMELQMQISN